MRYLGNKQKLLDFIRSAIEEDCGDLKDKSFYDLFCGSSTVAKYFRPLTKKVVTNDLEEYSYALSKNYISGYYKEEYQNIIEELNNLPGKVGRITENFSPYSKIGRKFFTTNNAMKIDSIRKEIEKYKEDSNLYYFLLCSLLETADSYSNTTGVYGAFLKNFDKRSNSDLILKPYLPASGNEGTCYNEDINSLIKNLQGDILYLDPPYNSRQYGANYHILNYIVNDNFVISKKSDKESLTGLGEYNKSQFSAKNKAKLAMEDLISKSSGFNRIYMSYNNEGILSKDEIKQIFEKYGDYSLVTKEHKRFKSNLESDNRKVLEQLHILKR